jgi:squalene/oxidosqualene cyclase-like protein
VGRAPGDALSAAASRLLALQSPRGDWEGEMVWCPMITAQYVLTQYLVDRVVPDTRADGLRRYFFETRTPDGVWALHPEGDGSVFVTTLVYVALRLLGLARDEPALKDARDWLHRQPGGVLAIPTWGKFWLALAGLYDWRGVSPTPPELFLLPRRLPVHPSRWYCHTRAIYVAMACLQGWEHGVALGALRDELREELYGAPWGALDFPAHAGVVSTVDLHAAPSRWLRLLQAVLRRAPVVPGVRRRALAACRRRVADEQRASAYQALSPVSGLLACIALYAADPAHPDLAPSLEGVEAWRWEDAGGVRYAGARSNAWDTAFALRALAAAPATRAAAGEALQRGYAFLRDTQITAELPDRRAQDRDPLEGGWCFSDGAHRWPVSDCAAEAVSALLQLHDGTVEGPARVDRERLRRAAAFIMSRQNTDGGFSTYERRRGPAWLDRLNPSEMFGRCMIDPSYVECTASSIGALARLRAAEPSLDSPAIARAIADGAAYLRRQQFRDGSLPAAWGIHFTYAIFHFTQGLRAAGAPPADPALGRAAGWLVGHQRADGGWGEHWTAARDGRYVEHPVSQPVMTAWALLALLEIAGPAHPSVTRGIEWLVERQREDGGWDASAVNGVFFGSAMLDYRLYPAYFPAWALARFAAKSVEGSAKTYM